ncbi:MAG: hypothetical protein PVF96_08235 [Candidatus Bathyarchaeota archaeon]
MKVELKISGTNSYFFGCRNLLIMNYAGKNTTTKMEAINSPHSRNVALSTV